MSKIVKKITSVKKVEVNVKTLDDIIPTKVTKEIKTVVKSDDSSDEIVETKVIAKTKTTNESDEESDDSSSDSSNESEKEEVKKPLPKKKVIKKRTVKKTDSSNGECDVCCDKYNHSTRKLLKCPFCQFNACTGCIRKFLLSIHQEPHCMKCKTAWSRDFWMDSFPKVFINVDLKKHRELDLLDREKSLLPASQPAAERIREANRLKKTLDNLRANIQKEKITLWNFNQDGAITDEKEIYDKKKELSLSVAAAQFELDYQQAHINDLMFRTTNTKQEPRKQFVRACPADGCKGMLSTQWKCGLCAIFVCPDCHEIIGETKDAPHTCKPENIATAKLLAKDTKTCPKCASLIFRISGCSQIWCLKCHHAFDWDTGKTIDYSVLHNPHFFAFRAQNGNIPANADVPCGGIPSQYTLQDKVRSFKLGNQLEVAICQRFLSSLYHNHDVEMRRFRPADGIINNEDLRVKFLLNEIDEEKFKRVIFYREKVEAKKTEIYRVMELFDTVSRDIAVRLNATKTASEFVGVWNEVTPLVNYANLQMRIISKRYNHITPKINSETYRWSR